MKRTFIVLLLLIGNYCVTIGQSDGLNLFDDSYLHEIRFNQVDTSQFIATKDYQQLQMIVDGVSMDSIGFKRKGNISGYPSTNKYGIKIKSNKYVEGKEYDGIKEFTLHMNYQDGTMMREKLTYDICRDMGLFSLRTVFSKVYINDIYWGLYTLVEGKDEMYKQVFDNRDMDAIESLDFGSMCYLGDNSTDYDYNNNGGNPTYQLENGDPITAWPRFVTMVGKANNTPNDNYVEEVSKTLNLKDFFIYQAINVYLMNFDSYIGFLGNQIYVYDEFFAKWQITPWDFNASFGLWNTNNHSPSSYPLIPTNLSNGCIASKMEEIEELKYYYLDAMCALNKSVGDTSNYFNKIDYWSEQIKEAVYEDRRKVSTNEDFERGIGYGYHNLFGENQPGLKTFIRERLAVVKNGLEEVGYNCTPTSTVDNERVELNFNVFPNPANDKIEVDFEKDSNYNLSIFNLLGQQVLYKNSIDNIISIDHLNKGIYFINIYNESNKVSLRFVKD